MSLHSTTIDGSLIPALIDEIPVLAVMAAFADGTTVIGDAQELKVKDSAGSGLTEAVVLMEVISAPKPASIRSV